MVCDGRADVDVRVVDLRADETSLRRAEASLTAPELARARRGTPAVHRRRVLLRAALRSALADELGLAPAAVPLAVTPTGRPYVDGGAPVDVSCSASGGIGVVAVARGHRVGIDVQSVAPWDPGVLDEGWLSPAERSALRALPPADRAEAVTRAWTQKEAVVKARGTGLADDLAATETAIGRDPEPVAGWEIRNVPVPRGWVASLAVGHRSEETPS